MGEHGARPARVQLPAARARGGDVRRGGRARCRRRSAPEVRLRWTAGASTPRATDASAAVRPARPRGRGRRRSPACRGAPTCACGPRRGSRRSCAAPHGIERAHAVDEYVEIAGRRAPRGRRAAGRRALLGRVPAPGPARSPPRSPRGSGRPSISMPISAAESRSGMTRWTSRAAGAGAPAARSRSPPGTRRARRPERARRLEAQHARPARDRRGVEVRHRPRAAVDVLAPVDAHRLEHARDRARRLHRVGDARLRRARARRTPRACRCARSTVQTRSRPSNRARQSATRRCRSVSGSGRPARAPARASARRRPPGRRRPARAAASGAVACQPTRDGLAQHAPAARRPRAGAARGRVPGRRSSRPATSRAATIEPADVPTNARQSANRTPPASSSPASTPFIQPSPRIPPPPRTSTSGSRKLTRTRRYSCT